MVASPSFDKTVRKTVVWLVKTAQRRATPTYKTEETTKEPTTTSILEQEKVVRASELIRPSNERNAYPFRGFQHSLS